MVSATSSVPAAPAGAQTNASSPTDWRARLNGDPLPWLLDAEEPAVRQRALRELLDKPADDPEVVEARRLAMTSDPIATILAAQDPGGWWVYPGAGNGPKYSGTVWTVMFLDPARDRPDDHRMSRSSRILRA